MAKDCGNHRRENFLRLIFFTIVFLLILIALVILIVYLVLRPTKPKFYLQDATILQFNLSQPNLLTSQLQVTISTYNPNSRIGIYYDRLDVYASYNYQQITLSYGIPPIYQGHKDSDVWSPYLYGSGIPIAPFLGQALMQDESDGYFFLYVKIDGRLRWKVGSWTSGHYRIFVNCPAYLSFDRSMEKLGVVKIKFQKISTCSVDV